jgi:hypothetical protein
MIQYLAILPFVFPLVGAVLITLYVIIVFEINAHRAQLPENEAYTEIGQWGPFVVAGLVFIATLTAKVNGWDFDTKDADRPNRGFEWLLGGDRSKEGVWDESLRSLLPDQEPFTLLPDVVISPIELHPLREHHWGLRRGSQAP